MTRQKDIPIGIINFSSVAFDILLKKILVILNYIPIQQKLMVGKKHL